MTGIWLAGAEVIAGIDGGQFSGAPWRGVLHTTEGSTVDGAVQTFQSNNFWPHFTIGGATNRIVQHLSLDVAGRALVTGNRDNCIQIEIVGNAVDTPNWTREQLEFVAGVMREIEAMVPIPRRSSATFKKFPASFGLSNGVRLSQSEWATFSGWCGHQHVPGNDHGDPGQIDIGKLCSPRLLGVGSSQSSPGPAAVARSPYELDAVFARSDRPYAEAWSGAWDGIGTAVGDGQQAPVLGCGVATVARRPDVLDVFWVTSDGSIYNTFWTRANGWTTGSFQIVGPSTPSAALGGLAAVSSRPGKISLFFPGRDDRIHAKEWTDAAGWGTPPQVIGGSMPLIDQTGGVSAVCRRRDVLDVFAFGQDGQLYTTWWTEAGGWAGNGLAIGGSVAANVISGVGAVARGPDALDVVFVGSDARLYATSWTPSAWTTPVQIGDSGAALASVVAGPAIVSRRPEVLDVFWIGQDGGLYTTWWTESGGWNPSSLRLGSSALALSGVATPAALARQPDILDVFVVDANDQVHTIWWGSWAGWATAFTPLDV
jgi:hypothetical protein